MAAAFPPSSKLGTSHHHPTMKNAKNGMRIQLGATIGGAVLLFLCLGVIGGAWVANYLDTTDALTTSSHAFRIAHAETLSADIAAMMKPLWVLMRQAVNEMAETRSIDGVQVMPPSLDTIYDHAHDLHTFLWTKVNAETHMRQVESLENFEHNNIVGCGAALFCAEEACAGGAFAHNPESCGEAVGVTSFLINNGGAFPPEYGMDRQYIVNGTVYRQINFWDYLAEEFTGTIDIPAWTCAEATGVLWASQPDYHNFSWYGPVDPQLGWESYFLGGVPIYDTDQQMIGGVYCGVAQGVGVGRILTNMLEEGGEITTGAELAIVTTAGEVIGLSEDAASVSDSQAATVSEIVASSYTGSALSKIKEEHGTVCPASQYLIDDDENQRLVDVTPFRTQDWGMPCDVCGQLDLATSVNDHPKKISRRGQGMLERMFQIHENKIKGFEHHRSSDPSAPGTRQRSQNRVSLWSQNLVCH